MAQLSAAQPQLSSSQLGFHAINGRPRCCQGEGRISRT
jgi:hypothetical protein